MISESRATAFLLPSALILLLLVNIFGAVAVMALDAICAPDFLPQQ